MTYGYVFNNDIRLIKKDSYCNSNTRHLFEVSLIIKNQATSKIRTLKNLDPEKPRP